MTREDDSRRANQAAALRAEAGRLRDLAMLARNPLRAVGLTLQARRLEKRAAALKAESERR